MSLFNPKTLSVKRGAASSAYVKGRWVPQDESTPITIRGSVQPSNGYKVQTLIEGKRLQGIVEIFTATLLKAADPQTGLPADRVTIDGLDWEVIMVEPWQNGILSHYVATAIREKETVAEVAAG